jgi:hypothetical protein
VSFWQSFGSFALIPKNSPSVTTSLIMDFNGSRVNWVAPVILNPSCAKQNPIFKNNLFIIN